MPVLKHAKKKLQQDKARLARNAKVKETFKELVKSAKANPSADALSKAFSGLDKAVKENVIHKNKAARMKSSLSRLVAGAGVEKRENKTSEHKTTEKKTSKKAKTTSKKS